MHPPGRLPGVSSASRRPFEIAGPILAACAALVLCACQPKVQIVAPKEPITINLNVKIEHEVRVKVDRELEQLFEKEGDLF
jgi:YnbE-like lipoprotein